MVKLLAGLMFLIILLLSSCRKVLRVDPPINQITVEKVFLDSVSINGAVGRIYSDLVGIEANLAPNIDSYVDDLEPSNTTTANLEFFNASLSPGNAIVSNIWRRGYSIIYQSNYILEGLPNANNLSNSLKSQIEGEVRFLRALSYYYLTNLWGDVPLITSTDVSTSASSPRLPQSKIYLQIIEDLKISKNLLTDLYPTVEKVRANKFASIALLSRVYLYVKDWENAELESSAVIQSQLYTPLLTDPTTCFVKNSKEAILQIWLQNGFYSIATSFIPAGTSPPQYLLTKSFLNSIAPMDLRRNWVRTAGVYNSPLKYRQRMVTTGANAEYAMVLRIGEQYLIRSESRLNLGRIADAISDINVIRGRAKMPLVTTNITSDSCVNLLEKERRHELFTETAHRFFDLKRTNKIDAVLKAVKSTWRPEAGLFPIPSDEILRNPNLYQNKGY
jgi:starch-binding outer membrane protein, SusD/RagB family